MDENSPLRYFLVNYLNQDWSLDHPTVWDAAQECFEDLAGSGPGEVPRIATEARDLAATHSEGDLAAIFATMGSYYYPPGNGHTYAAFLTDLAIRADAFN